MRVLAVTNLYPTDAAPVAGTFVADRVRMLRHLGVDVDVEFFDRLAQGARVYRDVSRVVRNRLATGRYDLVHVMYGGVLAALVTGAADAPTIVSFCGSDLLGEPCSGVARRAAAHVGVVASRRAARRATFLIVMSRNLERVLPADIDRSRVRVIPDGVDTDLFRPLDRDGCRRALRWPREPLHALFCHSSDPLKRPWLARAGVTWAEEHGVPVVFHEMKGVAHHEVPLWLNAADLLILTSVHEGSPNIVKEALACGVPVVAVDVGDVRERLDPVTGCYVVRPDPEAIGRAIVAVANGPRRIASGRGLDGISLIATTAQVRACYEQVVGRRGGRGASGV